MAAIDIYTIPAYGIDETDPQWPQITTALQEYGWTISAINQFKDAFSHNWNRGAPIALATIFKSSGTYANWIGRNGRKPTMEEEEDLVPWYWDGWKRDKCETVIFGTPAWEGNELGARLVLNGRLIAPGKNGGYTIFYKKFTDPTQSSAQGSTLIHQLPLPIINQKLFGGVDVTQISYAGQGIRPNLFRIQGLDAADYVRRELEIPKEDISTTKQYLLLFNIPKYLDFVWDALHQTQTFSDERKEGYRHHIHLSIGPNESTDRFRVGANSRYDEKYCSEMWKKKVSVNQRLKIFTLRVNEDDTRELQKYLTEQALHIFTNGSASDVVDTFGTHYMVEATFGGLRQGTTNVDIHNRFLSQRYWKNLRIQAPRTSTRGLDETSNDERNGTTPSSPDGDISNIIKADWRSLLIDEFTSTDIKGGILAPGDEKKWLGSLYNNPAVVGYKLRNISDLIIDPKKAAEVKKEAERRMKKAGFPRNRVSIEFRWLTRPVTGGEGSEAKEQKPRGAIRKFFRLQGG